MVWVFGENFQMRQPRKVKLIDSEQFQEQVYSSDLRTLTVFKPLVKRIARMIIAVSWLLPDQHSEQL